MLLLTIVPVTTAALVWLLPTNDVRTASAPVGQPAPAKSL
jgi:hypothetical protein